MKKKILVIIATVLMICFILPFVSSAVAKATNNSNKQWTDQELEEIYNTMTLDQKITQTFMQSFRSWNGTPVTELNPEIRQILKDYKFGGIIIFAENVPTTENTFNMVKDYQTTTIDGSAQVNFDIVASPESIFDLIASSDNIPFIVIGLVVFVIICSSIIMFRHISNTR